MHDDCDSIRDRYASIDAQHVCECKRVIATIVFVWLQFENVDWRMDDL